MLNISLVMSLQCCDLMRQRNCSDNSREKQKSLALRTNQATSFEGEMHPPILMSASWSAGTSLKVNGETSLHMPKALAIPRRVSLAFIKFVGKESNLLGNNSTVWLIVVPQHIPLQLRNLPKHNSYCSDTKEFPHSSAPLCFSETR